MVPVRKGREEEADSKTETVVGVKTANRAVPNRVVRAKEAKQTNERMREQNQARNNRI